MKTPAILALSLSLSFALIPSTSPAQLIGDQGNDWIVGGTDRDTATGGSGNDTLLGDRGIDHIAAVYDPASRLLLVQGTDQDETLEVSTSREGALLVNGGTVRIEGGSASLKNTAGILIHGQGGSDVIMASSGLVKCVPIGMHGAAGDDIYVWTHDAGTTVLADFNVWNSNKFTTTKTNPSHETLIGSNCDTGWILTDPAMDGLFYLDGTRLVFATARSAYDDDGDLDLYVVNSPGYEDLGDVDDLIMINEGDGSDF